MYLEKIQKSGLRNLHYAYLSLDANGGSHLQQLRTQSME